MVHSNAVLKVNVPNHSHFFEDCYYKSMAQRYRI